MPAEVLLILQLCLARVSRIRALRQPAMVGPYRGGLAIVKGFNVQTSVPISTGPHR